MARPEKHVTFLYRVYKNVRPSKNGCIEFFGCKNEDGYGRINKFGKLVYVHREIYKEFNGDFDEKMSVCHTCDNPSCVNINHLYLGTHAENMADKSLRKRVTNAVGEKNPSSKLRESDVSYIKKRIRNGEKCYHIAREYGVNGETILHIKNGRTWRHVI